MAIVKVQFPTSSLQSEMQHMRLWLDTMHLEPSGFRYETHTGRPVAEIAFTARKDAEAFARAFAGLVEG
jgi:hypothetical protein